MRLWRTEALTPVAPQDLDLDDESPAGYAEDYRDLPEEMVNAFRAHLSSRRAEERFSRRREVIRDRTNRFYERGYQHIYWNDTRGKKIWEYELHTYWPSWLRAFAGFCLTCKGFMAC